MRPIRLPIVAVGGGVGKGHRHIKVATRTPVGCLWSAVANRYGGPYGALRRRSRDDRWPLLIRAHRGLQKMSDPRLLRLDCDHLPAVGQGPDADGTTPLHKAVLANDLSGVQKLLRSGANPSASNRYGVTPLSLAAVNGNPALVEVLLKAGADAKANLPGGQTLLMTAARTGNPDVVRILLDHGGDPNARELSNGETALMWAAAENHPEAAGC